MRIIRIFGNMRIRMKISSTLSTCNCKYLPEIAIFELKWVSLALFSILSAQNIIIVHPSGFYPSSGIIKSDSPESQYFSQKIFFTIWCSWCALANIGAWSSLISTGDACSRLYTFAKGFSNIYIIYCHSFWEPLNACGKRQNQFAHLGLFSLDNYWC